MIEKKKESKVVDKERLKEQMSKARRLDAYVKNLQTLRRRKKEDDYGKRK